MFKSFTKRIISWCLFLIFLTVAHGQTLVNTNQVTGTWTVGKSPYLITTNVVVPEGSTLNIQPGVVIQFEGKYKLSVNGQLLAEGEEENPIVFTASDSILKTNRKASWLGIKFSDSKSDTSKLSWCLIQYADATGSILENATGGGISVVNYHYLEVTHCQIAHNTSAIGGGLYAHRAQIFLEYCKIKHNHALTNGGGLYVKQANVMLKNSTIENNTAHNLGGGICSQQMEGYWFNNIIYGNKANFGGALSFKNDKSTLINNTLTDNKAAINGGAIHMESSNTRYINSIFWNNHAPGKEDQGYLFTHSNPGFWYCNIQGGSEGIEVLSGFGSYVDENLYGLDANPQFIINDTLSYGLQEGSPCIDAGLSEIDEVVLPMSDNGGRYRINNEYIDLGAHEFNAMLLPEFLKEIEDGQKDVEDANLDLLTYPNPSNGNFRVVITEAEDTHYSLVINDLLGYEAFKKPFYRNGPVTVVEVQMNAHPGLYMLTLRNSDGRIVNESKIIIKGKAKEGKPFFK